MSSTLYLGKLDVRKVAELADKAFKGQKGDYLDVAITVYDEPNSYGNQVSVTFGKKKEDRVYLANAKKWEQDGGGNQPPF